MQAQVAAAEKPFSASREKLEEIIEQLSAKDTLGMQHGPLERLLESQGRELLRFLFQDHLELRGPGDAGPEVVGSDGVVRQASLVRGRNLMTVFGQVRVNRQAYSKQDVASLHPLDAELNLPPETHSHGMQRKVAEEVCDRSFDATVAAVKRNTGGAVAKRQAEELAVRAAADFDTFYAARAAATPEEVASTGPIGVLTTDGKGIRVHEEDLRPETRKAAETKREAEGAKFSLGKAKPSAAEREAGKRMAQVAAVYTIEAFVRTPEEIVGELNRVQAAPSVKRPRPESKRVWASVEREAPEVIADAFAEALRRDSKMEKRWAALVDGNEAQIQYVIGMSEESGLRVTLILDLLHVAQYVWGAAHAFHAPNSDEAREWVRTRLLEILRGRSSDVAGGMRRSATRRGLSARERTPVDTCADYLLKYRPFLRYDEYLAAGLPITTGVAEGACRHLVKDRMELTGAIWGLESAEAVLKLRALESSHDFEEYWAFHEAQEHARNHAANYANATPPITAQPTKTTRRHLRVVK